MKRIKRLSKTQRAVAWRIARRFIGHQMNGNDPLRGTDGMTTQLRTLHVGRRLGRRICSRSTKDGHGWTTERNIVLIITDRHAGKIGRSNNRMNGWRVAMHPAVPGSTTCDTPTAFARIFPAGGAPPIDIRIRFGFPSEQQARTWLLTPEGQGVLRQVYLGRK